MPTDDELREMDEALERARAAGLTVNEGDDGRTKVRFVGEAALERIRGAFGARDERGPGTKERKRGVER